MNTTIEKIIDFYIEHNDEDFMKDVVYFYIENKMVKDFETSKEFLINMVENKDNKYNEKSIEMIKYYIDYHKEDFNKYVLDFYIENNKDEILLNIVRNEDEVLLNIDEVSKLRSILTLIVNVGTLYGIYRLFKKFLKKNI